MMVHYRAQVQDDANDEDELDQDGLAVEDENEGKRGKLKHNTIYYTWPITGHSSSEEEGDDDTMEPYYTLYVL